LPLLASVFAAVVHCRCLHALISDQELSLGYFAHSCKGGMSFVVLFALYTL
jgi:hypothetical protein